MEAASGSSATARKGRSRSSTCLGGATRQAGRAGRGGGAPCPSGRRRSCWPTSGRCWASTSPAIRSSSTGSVARRIGALTPADLAARSTGARVLAARAGQRVHARARPRAATAWPSPRSSWSTAACRSRSSPSPTESCAAALRHKGPVIVRGRGRRQRQGTRGARGGDQAPGGRGGQRRRHMATGTARQRRRGGGRARLPHPGARGGGGARRRCSPR